MVSCIKLGRFLIFEFAVLVIENDFFNLCLSLTSFTSFRGLIEPAKTTKISIERIQRNSQ
jgi:hypothetical protein